MSNWFKKNSNKLENLSIYIKYKVQYPVFFDNRKIHESIDAYFSVYFKDNPIKNINYTGISGFVFGSSFPLVDHCIVQFVFDENVKTFIDNQQEQRIRSELSKITSVEDKQIQLQFLTFSEFQDNIGSAKSLLETFDQIKSINDELGETKIKLEEIFMSSKEESSSIVKMYNELREKGLTDPEWDRILDNLEEKRREQQAEFEQIKNAYYDSNPFSKKIDQLKNEIDEYRTKRKEEELKFTKMYDELRQSGSTNPKSDQLVDEYEEISRKQLAQINQLKYEYNEHYIKNEKICQSIIELEKIRLKNGIIIPYHMRRCIMLSSSKNADSEDKVRLLNLIKDIIKQNEELVELLNSYKNAD